jgi:hypothetical protein
MQQTSDCMLFAFFIRPDILLLSGRNVNEVGAVRVQKLISGTSIGMEHQVEMIEVVFC